MKKAALLSLAVFSLFFSCLLFVNMKISGSENKPKSDQQIKLTRSIIIENLEAAKKQNPKITPRELADLGNILLIKKGFNYNFDICEALPEKERQRNPNLDLNALIPFSYNFKNDKGKKLSVQIMRQNDTGACSECFAEIPALSMTAEDMTVVSDGKQIKLKVPKTFLLDDVQLVEADLITVIRSWQLPFQTIPLGISADGTKLYTDVSYGEELNELTLELSENGKIQFKARSDIDLPKGEDLENFPKETDNDYLVFERFNVNGKSFIIKYSGPCT